MAKNTLVGMIILTTVQRSDQRRVFQYGQLVQSLFAPGFLLWCAWNARNAGGCTKKVTVKEFTMFAFGKGSVVGTCIFLLRDGPGDSGEGGDCGFVTTGLNRRKKKALAAVVAETGWAEREV